MLVEPVPAINNYQKLVRLRILQYVEHTVQLTALPRVLLIQHHTVQLIMDQELVLLIQHHTVKLTAPLLVLQQRLALVLPPVLHFVVPPMVLVSRIRLVKTHRLDVPTTTIIQFHQEH